MKITITKKVHQQIVDHCRNCFPLEGCGLIAGHEVPGGKEIVKAYLVKNISESRVYFTIDPEEQLKAVINMRKEGLIPLGNFHSHPETSADPSAEDRRLALDHRACYLIVSLSDRLPVVKCFHVTKINDESNVVEDDVEVV
ncbi:MAG: M67 family metallopeptidase [Deltaproteobacteria bacterium]|jgi:proteasome lid subunit RPN8/RPN11|nr:M67 family metallopeptidase [Deltaproteobacteria bacterium]